MKFESLDKFLADARLYFGLDEDSGHPAVERPLPPPMFPATGQPGQWNYLQPAAQACRPADQPKR